MKAIKDIFSIVYDSDGYMSMPRFLAVLLHICVIVSWIGDQFLGFKYDNFTHLCMLAGGDMVAYGWKKHEENKNHE